jgi:hypothetical protein
MAWTWNTGAPAANVAAESASNLSNIHDSNPADTRHHLRCLVVSCVPQNGIESSIGCLVVSCVPQNGIESSIG